MGIFGQIAATALTGGAAAPAVGAGLLRGAAKYTAPSLISAAGRAAAGVAAPAGKLASVAAMGLTEGAIYAGSDVIEKGLLPDSQLTIEQAATEIGLGGLFGGALGVGGFGAAKGLGKLLTKTTEGLETVATKIADGDPATIKLMFQNKSDIAALEKVSGGATEAIQSATPEMAQFILSNAGRITKMERGFPGLIDVLAKADPDTAELVIKDWGNLLKDPQRRIEVGNALLDATQSTYSRVEQAFGQFNREVRPEEAEALLSGPHTVDIPGGGSALEVVPREEAVGEGNRVVGYLNSKINEMRAKPDLFEGAYAKEAEQFRDGLIRTLTQEPSPPAIFQQLRMLRQQLDGDIPWNAETRGLAERKAISQFKELRTYVKNSITGKVWGQAGVRQGALDIAYTDYFTARKQLLSKLGEGTGTAKVIAPTKVNAWVNAMADMRGKVKTDAFTDFTDAATKLANEMETSGLQGAPQIRQEIQQAVAMAREIRDKATVTQIVKMLQGREILSSGPAVSTGRDLALAAARRIPGGIGTIIGAAADIPKKFRDPAKVVATIAFLDKLAKQASKRLDQSIEGLFNTTLIGAAGAKVGDEMEHFAHGGKVTAERYDDVADHIRHLSSGFDGLTTAISKQTGGLQNTAPAASNAANTFGAKAVQHLASRLPGQRPRLLLDRPFKPSATELAVYNRSHEVANGGPNVVLRHVARGTLHSDHLATSAALFPRFHEEAKTKVFERLAQHLSEGRKVPIRLREPLGMFLGNPLEWASTPQAILANQQSYLEASQPAPAIAPQPAQAKSSGKPRQVETHLSERSATASEGNQMRMGSKA